MDNMPMIWAVDFDGTLCQSKWPNVGKPNVELIRHLKKMQKYHDVKLILWTCRTDEMLAEAIEWCKEQGLIFNAVNENLPESIEYFGGNSRKIFAHKYIDDSAIAVADW